MRDDVQLIQDILDGDESAFSDLVDKYQKSIHALAWRKTGDFHVAEEIAQDTFLQAYKKLPNLRNPRHFTGWLYVIADRCCKAWFRKKKVYMQSLEATDSETLEQNVYSDYIYKQREEEAVDYQRKIVEKLLEKLPESERTVIVLYYLGEMSCEEISKFLGVSPNTVKSRLSRGRERLQQEKSIVREALSNVQLPTNLTENIMKQIDKVKNVSPQSTKPVPWGVLASTALLVIALIGASNQAIKNHYQPISLDENSETTIEIVDAPVFFHNLSRRDLKTLDGSDTIADKNRNNGETQGTETVQNNLSEDPMQWNLPENAKTRLGKGRIREIEYSPDGSILAAMGDIGIWIYDASTFQELAMYPTESTRFQSLSFIANDRILARIGLEQVILLWDANSFVLERLLNRTKPNTEDDGSNLDVKIPSDADDNRIDVSNIITVRETKHVNEIKKNEDRTSTPDRKMLVGVKNGSEHSNRLLDVNKLEHNKNLDVNNQEVISTIAYSADRTLMASGGTEYNILLWDGITNEHLRAFSGHTSNITKIDFSPDGKTIVSVGDDGTIRFWEVETGTLLKTLTGYSVGVKSVSFNADGKIVANTNRDGSISIWDAINGETKNTIIGVPDRFDFLVFHPNRNIIACGDGRLSIWDPTSTAEKKILTENIQGIHFLALAPDGKTLATAHEDCKINLWDSQNGKLKATLAEHKRRVFSVAFSPDNKSLASASDDNTVRLWDVLTGKEIDTFTGHTNGVKSVAFSPDGKTLVSGDGNNLIMLWNMKTGKIKEILSGHEHRIHCLTFSPDGKTIASGGGDSNVNLWDANTGELEKALNGHTNQVRSISFSPDGKTLASSSDDGTVLIWNIKQE